MNRRELGHILTRVLVPKYHDSPSMIRIYFPKKNGNGSPKWSFASADFQKCVVINHIGGFKIYHECIDVIPIGIGGYPASYVSLLGVHPWAVSICRSCD